MQSHEPPVLKGKAAQAILEDLKQPLTKDQLDIVWLALEEFKSIKKEQK